VARRYLEYYSRFAEEAVPALVSAGREPWLERLGAEEVNFQAALEWGLDHTPAYALRLAAALPWYWYFRGALGEGRRWLERSLTTASTDDLVLARAQFGAGALAWAQGDHAAARSLLEQAVPLLQACADGRTVVHALAMLTLTAHDQTDHDRAVLWAQQATAAGHAERDPWSLALALTAEGAARFGAGDLDGADAALEGALGIWAELGDSWGSAMALLNRGRIAFARNILPAAATYLKEGLARLHHAGDRRFSAAALLLLGEIARKQGDFGLACARYAASLASYEEIGAGWGTRLCLQGLAAACAAEGKAMQAARLLGAASAVPAPGAAARPRSEVDALDQLRRSLQAAYGAELIQAHVTGGRLLTPQQAVVELAEEGVWERT
jgi:tetratricopeptide (TPR) repeat protein